MPAIVAGGVYVVDDNALSLPPNDNRTYHQSRPLIVISGSTTNSDPNWPTALVVPTSSSTQMRTRFCVKLGHGEGGLDRKTWARVPAAQPLMKSELTTNLGIISGVLLEEIHARLLEFMGLLDDD